MNILQIKTIQIVIMCKIKESWAVWYRETDGIAVRQWVCMRFRETTKMQSKKGFHSKLLMLPFTYNLTQYARPYCKFFPLLLFAFYSLFLIQKIPCSCKKESAQMASPGWSMQHSMGWEGTVPFTGRYKIITK